MLYVIVSYPRMGASQAVIIHKDDIHQIGV